MKCAQFTGVRDIRIGDIRRPVLINDDEVLIRTGSVGICGSDIHYYTEGRIGDQVIRYPHVPGHECSGTVVETGSIVSNLNAGDKIAIEPAVSCGQCDQCLAGRENTCRNLKFLGSPNELNGCMSEYLVIPERNCFILPDGMTLDQGAFAEPLSISIYGLKYIADLTGLKIAVLGAGPIGLSALLEARCRQAGAVYVTDKLDERLAVSRSCGADLTGNPVKENIVEKFLRHEPQGLDVVVECCGQQEAIDQAIELLKPGGILLIIGIPSLSRLSFDISVMRRKEITVQNVRRQNNCLQTAVDRIASGHIRIDDLITHTAPLSASKELYETVAGYKDNVIKAMVRI